MEAREAPDSKRVLLARAFLREAAKMLLHPVPEGHMTERDRERYVNRASVALEAALDLVERPGSDG